MNIKDSLVKILQPELRKAIAGRDIALVAFKEGRLSHEEMTSILEGFTKITVNMAIDKLEIDQSITNWGICNSPNAIQERA